MPGGFEPLHAPLALAGGLMGVFRSVIQVAMLAMFHTRQGLALRRPIARQFIRNDDPRHVGQPLQQFTKELLRRLLIPLPLHENIQDVAVLIHRPPEIVSFAVDGEKDRINGLVPNDKFCLSRQSPTKLGLLPPVCEILLQAASGRSHGFGDGHALVAYTVRIVWRIWPAAWSERFSNLLIHR
jgi:hypothetical protein